MRKDLAKAIRIVHGLTSDLRIKLTSKQEKRIHEFLDDNILTVYGTSIYEQLGTVYNPFPTKNKDDYEKVQNFLKSEARAVARGGFEE